MDTGTYKTRHTLIFEVLITVLTLFVFFLSVFFSEEVFASTQYTVSSAQEFNEAVEDIKVSDASEATIVLAADISGQETFNGISGKKIIITSAEGDTRSLDIHNTVILEGNLTIDRIKMGYNGSTNIFACGNTFETTADFEGFVGDSTDAVRIYGGGPAGQDVDGDTHIILRGSFNLTAVSGGGLNSDVGGSTNVLIDAVHSNTGQLTGGGVVTESGFTAQVGGDTNIRFTKGWTTSITGAGRNDVKNSTDRESARVFGDSYITTGEENATSYEAVIGTAMPCYGGSVKSTVTNTHFTILPGTINYRPDDDMNYKSGPGIIFGAGAEDIVLGTVSVEVKKGGCGSRIILIYGGSDQEGDDPGVSEIRNINGEENAIHIVYENDDDVSDMKAAMQGHFDRELFAISDDSMYTEVNGNVLVEIKDGDFDYIVLDSDTQNSEIIGDATVLFNGGRAGDIWGNMGHWNDSSKKHKSAVLFDGAGTTDKPQEIGRLNYFEETILTNESNVNIDSLQFDNVYYGAKYKPFNRINNLTIEKESILTTRNSDTQVLNEANLNNGTWHALGRVYVYEGTESKDSHIYLDNYFALGYNHRNDGDAMSEFTAWKSENDEMIVLNQGYCDRFYGNVELDKSDVALLSVVNVGGNWTGGDSMLRLPAVATDENYDGTADTDIPINIDGKATGSCKVLTVTADNADKGQVAQKPTLGDNYITGWKANGESDEVFLLENEDAIAEGLYLKRIADLNPDTQDTYYMWQVAKLDTHKVKYEYKGDTPDGAPALPEDKEYYWRMRVDLEDEPTLEGYTFSGWESEDVEITDKSLLRMATANKAFVMPDKDVTISGTWTKNAPSDPDDKDDPDSPSDKDTPNTPPSQGSTDTTDDSDSTNDSGTADGSKDKGSSASKKKPKTSDDNDLRLYAAIMMLAILGETAVFAVRKRN